MRKSARREIQLDTETSYKTTQSRKRKEPSSPQAKRVLGRQKMLIRNAEIRELKDQIEILKTTPGYIRSYNENCLVLVYALGCRLKALEKSEPISTTQLADEVSAGLRLANRNGQVTCAYELIKHWGANKEVLQTASDRSAVDYASRRILKPFHLVEIENFINSRHKKGNHANVRMVIEHLGKSRPATENEPRTGTA